MPKLRGSLTFRQYDPDDDDQPRTPRKKKSDPLREIGILAVIFFIIWVLYQASQH
jgi:hypothetical protein